MIGMKKFHSMKVKTYLEFDQTATGVSPVKFQKSPDDSARFRFIRLSKSKNSQEIKDTSFHCVSIVIKVIT